MAGLLPVALILTLASGQPPVAVGGWTQVDRGPIEEPDPPGVTWSQASLPDALWLDPGLLLISYDVPFELYVEGTGLVYRHKNLATEDTSAHVGYGWFLISLPHAHNAYWAGQKVWLRSRSAHPAAIPRHDLPRAGERGDLVVEMIQQELDEVLVSMMSIIFGLVALLVFARRREQRGYLHFGLFAIASGLVTLSLTRSQQLAFEAPLVMSHVRFFGRAVQTPMLAVFVVDVLRKDARWARPMIRVTNVVVLVALGAVALDVVAHRPFHPLMAHLLNVEFIAAWLFTALVLVDATARKVEGARILLIAVGFSFAMAVWEVVTRIGWLDAERTHDALGQIAILLGAGNVLLGGFTRVYGELQREVKARDEFVSIASHELRSPLAVISAEVELLAVRPDKLSSRLPRMREQIKLMARVVDDLFDLSRARYGKLVLHVERTRLDTVVSDIVDQETGRAARNGITLLCELPPTAIWTDGDPARLGQVVGNLVRNAIRHSPRDTKVVVSMAAHEGWATIRVRDHGEGIAPEMLERMFVLFEQGVEAGGEGMGVGLALVRRLVTLHGGTVTATSAGVGKGSEFVVRLRTVPPPDEAPVESAAGAAPQDAAGATSRARVLLVDDNANLRLTTRLLLQHGGFEVAEASSGVAGVERLLGGEFDAAVVDLRMPDLDGFEVARRVRAVRTPDRLRLVALTGSSEQTDVERARAVGFDEVLTKPAGPEVLMRALRRPVS